MRLLLVLTSLLVTTAFGCHPAFSPAPPTPSRGQQPVDCEAVWWLTVRFDATQHDVEGVPLRVIDSTWVAALPLSPSLMPPEWGCRFRTSDSPGLAFRLDGDFNGDGQRDRAIVGVYRAARAQEGRFLLILTRGTNARWKLAELLSIPGQPGFSVLTIAGRKISWWMCLECDDGIDVAWDGHHYSPLPPDTTHD